MRRNRLKVFLLCAGLISPFPLYPLWMPTEWILQGRTLSAADLAQIRAWRAEHPSWHRTRLSRELCTLWGWRNAVGQPKDMAARSLLLKLEAHGLIELPPRRGPSANGRRNHRPAAAVPSPVRIQGPLASLVPLEVVRVAPGSAEARLFGCLLQHHHYLGHRNCVGQNLKYLVRDGQGRPLACALFGSAAWHCQARDTFIGWTPQARREHLGLVTNNTRWLILAGVRVPHLSSQLLSRITRRLSRDWQERYGHPIHLVETFVEAGRFAGTAYRAAGWIRVGTTTGRGRNGAAPDRSVKEVWLRPLDAQFRQRLGA